MAKSTTPVGQRTVMGFDFGTKYIGIAVGQEITGQASPLQSIKAKDGIPNWDQIGGFIKEWAPDRLIVGLPLNMDGTPQEMTKRAQKFANRLFAHFGVEIETQDERLTTADARAQIFEGGGYRALSKDKVDCVSACLIVESWFESQYGE